MARIDGHATISANHTITIRIESDTVSHNDSQTAAELADAAGLIAAVNEEFLRGQAYSEPTCHGYSVYPTFMLRPGDSAATINPLLATLQQSLQRFARERGFTSTLEVQGMLTVIERDWYHDFISYRSHPMRLPECHSDTDVIKLITAPSFPIGLLDEIIAKVGVDTPQADPQSQPPAASPHRTGPRKTRKPRAPRQPIARSGSKFCDRLACASAVVIGELGRSGDQAVILADDVRIGAMVEAANALYVASGLADHERDAARNRALRRHIVHFLEHYDMAKVGTGKADLWFGEVDLAKAEELVRSRIPAWALARAEKGTRKSRRGHVTYPALALALVTINKNLFGRFNGFTSSVAIQDMLHAFNLSCNGTLASTLLGLLRGAGLIICLIEAGHGVCCRWSPAGPAWRLPFIANLDHVEIQRQAMEQTPAPGGAAGASTSA
ncbi:MAG: hypothetical protein WCI73_15935, partial [Phycisphaerae bacterium]